MKVLRNFLKRERLYFKDDGWEERARGNLTWEIGVLEGGRIPGEEVGLNNQRAFALFALTAVAVTLVIAAARRKK